MNADQLNGLLDYAKGLFRYMTLTQGTVLAEMLADFPDPAFARDVMKSCATNKPVGEEEAWQEGNIPLTVVRGRLSTELRRRGLTTADVTRRETRKKEAVVLASWQKIDDMIGQCSDEDLLDLKPLALDYLTNDKAREMFKNKSARDSKTLRWLTYRVLTERGAA